MGKTVMRDSVWARRSGSCLARHLARYLAPCLATLLCIVLCLAGCGATAVVNPAANTLDVHVAVFDHESAQHAPSTSTHVEIALTTTNTIVPSNVVGADPKTLVCDGNTALLVEPGLDAAAGLYSGDLPSQTDHYTCTYSWSNGSQSAPIVIPVLLNARLSIRDPESGATVAVPGATEPGVTVAYDSSAATSAQVMATALDFNKRSAASDPSPDRGEVTIPADRFAASFGIGWGTITLTRTISKLDITARANNQAFHSVTLDTFEQAAQTPVRWL